MDTTILEFFPSDFNPWASVLEDVPELVELSDEEVELYRRFNKLPFGRPSEENK